MIIVKWIKSFLFGIVMGATGFKYRHVKFYREDVPLDAGALTYYMGNNIPIIMKSNKGTLVLMHGDKDGSMRFGEKDISLGDMIEYLESVEDIHECTILACYNGTRQSIGNFIIPEYLKVNKPLAYFVYNSGKETTLYISCNKLALKLLGTKY